MELEANLLEGAGGSSSFGTNLELVGEPRTGSTFLASSELIGGMSRVSGHGYESTMEITPEIGRETYALRPGIEFSTDLRMELSADVLASLGGSSNDVEKPHEDNLLEITSMREDMHFIPEIPMSPPPGPISSSDRGSFTSVGASPQTEADSGVYAPVGSPSNETPYDYSVPASTVSESQLNPQADSALGESTKEYLDPSASVFETSASASVEPPVDMVALAASLSFPVPCIDAGTPDAVGSSYFDACHVSSGVSYEPSSGDILDPVPGALVSENNENAASLSVLDASTTGDGFNTTLKLDRSTIPLTILNSSDLDMVTAYKKDVPPCDMERSIGDTGTTLQGGDCDQNELICSGSLQSPLGHMLSPAAGCGSELHLSSLLPEVTQVAHEEGHVASDRPRALQDVTLYDSKDPNSGSSPRVPTRSQVESSTLAEAELACLTSEPSEQFHAPAQHLLASSTSERAAVVLVDDLYVKPAPDFAEDHLNTKLESSRKIPDVITLPAPLSTYDQGPPISLTLEESEENGQPIFPQAPDKGLSLPSSVKVSELNQQPDLTGIPSLSPSLSSPFVTVLQSLDGASSAPETGGVQFTLISSDLDNSKSDATASSEPISLSTKAHQGESETVVPSARPGLFWDVPSSSGRFLTSLPTLSAYFEGSRSPFRGRKTARRKKSNDLVLDVKGKNSTEMDKMEEVVELESMVDAQKKAMQWQIDELQRIMMMQCQLTGRNPLSEEMVYDVLGEKGAGEEQPSAEALRHMREVFAIKDTITKKEAREISSMTGATVSQVREFFTAQKLLVKKLVQQVFDETGRVGLRNATEQSSIGVERDLGFNKLTSVESVERYLELMRAERTFFGQMQLMQIILQTDAASTILRRFLEKGGLRILHQWLVEAAAEEQTSVLRQLLKTLAHLPISGSVPHQMPAIVQNVNKLRFYHNLDVSTQGRALLAKWSKMLKQKSEAVKPSGSVGNKSSVVLEKNIGSAHGGMKRNRDVLPVNQGGSGPRKKKTKEEESMQPESKSSGVSAPGSPKVNVSVPAVVDTTPPALPSAKQRWSTTLQPSESAVAAVSVSRKRVASKSLGDHAKERRQVQLVEDTPAGKNLPSGVASKSTALKNSRPLSTDDIYKAKKLQRLMQEPLTKSRKKAAAAQEASQVQDVDPQATLKREFPHLQQQEISNLPANTPPSERSSLNKRNLPSASPIERSEVSKWNLFTSGPQQDFCQPSITPTSSPDRGPRIITPTSSPDRPQLIITPTSSPDRPQDVVRHNSPHGLPKIIPLSPEDSSQRAFTPTSNSSQDPLQTATVLDTTTKNSYRMSPSLTSGLTADGSQVIFPYSSNMGLIESVKRSEQPQQPTDVMGAGMSSVHKERSFVSGVSAGGEVLRAAESVSRENVLPPTLPNTKPAFVEPIQQSFPVPKLQFSPQRQLGGVQMYTIPSPTPPEENETTDSKQIVESSNSCIPSKERPVVDFYASLRANMIRWRIPPVYRLDPQWNIAAGEDSKEKEMQSARVRREEEAYYPDPSSIPSDPKDPWEEEPNYDDSLTFEIYLDNNHRKPVSGMQIQTDHISAPAINVIPTGILANSFMTEASNSTFSGYTAPDPSSDLSRKGPNLSGLDLLLQQLSASGGVAHDPALLSLLLQNPDLVNQLTSGQGYTQTGLTNQNILSAPMDPVKQPSNVGNLGPGLRTQTGDVGLDRFGASNIPVSMPSETLRVEEPALKHPPTGMGHQHNPGFVPQAGVDNRYPAPPQMQPAVGSTSGWEQARMAPPLPPLPPPPPLPPMPSGGNQVLQPSVQPQANKASNWPEPQAWNNVGAVVGRPPLNTAQIHSGQEQLHLRPQTKMTPNVLPPNYGGVVGMPQVEVNTVVSQQEMHNASQRQWTNGSHLVIAPSVNDNAMIQAGQDSGIGRNNRWTRPPGPPGPPPPDSQMRPVGREYSDFQGSRQANVGENLGVWVPNDRGRPGPPPFQGGYRPPPPPPPPPYPAPQQWHQTFERNVRPGPATAVPPFTLGRDLRPQQPQPPQPWHPNLGPPRPMWRGPQ